MSVSQICAKIIILANVKIICIEDVNILILDPIWSPLMQHLTENLQRGLK